MSSHEPKVIIEPTNSNFLLAGIVQLLIESAPWIGHVPSNVYAAKKPARVEVVPLPVQTTYKRVAVDTQVYNHKKPEVVAPVINYVITEESNGRKVHNPQGSIVQNGLDSQNNEHRAQNMSDGERKVQNSQKLPDISQKLLPESEELKAEERVAKVQSLPENGLKVHKLPDKGVKSPDNLLKTQIHKSEIPPQNGPMIQHSQDDAFRNRNHPRSEENRVEPSATVPATEVLNKEEHPPSLTSKDKELITPNSWTGMINHKWCDAKVIIIMNFHPQVLCYLLAS